MKIAVCFAGMPRYYDKCCDSLLSYFNLDGIEVDFFIHSWTNIWYHPKVGNNTVTNQDQQFLETELHRIYTPKKMIIEDQLSNMDIKCAIDLISQIYYHTRCFTEIPPPIISDIDNKHNEEFLTNKFHFGQLYSVSRAIELKSQYEHDENIKYDLVLRARLDNYMEPVNPSQSIHKICKQAAEQTYIHFIGGGSANSETIYCQWISTHGQMPHIGDKFFGGSSTSMDIFRDIFKFQIVRIIQHLTGNKHDFQFTPEAVIGDLLKHKNYIAHHHLWPGNVVSYRDYHVDIDQEFNNMQLVSWENER